MKFIKDLALTPTVICEYGNILKIKSLINNVRRPSTPPIVDIKIEKVKFLVATDKYNCIATIDAVPIQPIKSQYINLSNFSNDTFTIEAEIQNNTKNII